MNDTRRTILIAALVFLGLPLLWGVMMVGGMGSGMMWGWDGAERWDRGRGLMMMIPTLIVIGGIMAAIAWGVGRADSSSAPPTAATARDILDARYARGDITRDQYQQMKGDLGL